MAKQTVTLRLDEDDLTYLAQVELPGASNLSEKIRVLLADARRQRDGLDDAGAAFDFSRRLFSVPERALRQAELDAQMRSELIARVLAWLPETTAFVLADSAGSGQDAASGLRRFERGLGERVLALTDSVLQLARAGFPGCYGAAELSQRAAASLSTAGGAAIAPSTSSGAQS